MDGESDKRSEGMVESPAEAVRSDIESKVSSSNSTRRISYASSPDDQASEGSSKGGNSEVSSGSEASSVKGRGEKGGASGVSATGPVARTNIFSRLFKTGRSKEMTRTGKWSFGKGRSGDNMEEINVEETDELKVKVREGKKSEGIVPYGKDGGLSYEMRVELVEDDEDLENMPLEKGYSVTLGSSTSIYKANEFVRKTLFLVLLQSFFSFTFITISYIIGDVNAFFQTFHYLGIILFFLLLGLLVLLSFKPNYTDKSLAQYFLIPIVTFVVSSILTAACCYFEAKEIIAANVIFVLTIIFAIFFTTQKKFEFTSWIGQLATMLFLVLCYGIYAPFVVHFNAGFFITAIGVLLVTLYILIDVQLMVKGKRSFTYKSRDYRRAAVALYYDLFRGVLVTFLHFKK